MLKIVTLTLNPTVDKSNSVDQVVADRKLRCTEPVYEPGGGGLNVSRALKRLGGESFAIFTTGGHMGEMLSGMMQGEGIEHRAVRTRAQTRENHTVLETTTGRQFRFGDPGPKLTEDELRECIDAVTSVSPPPEYVVASGSLPPGAPPDSYARLGDKVRQTNARFVLDTSGDALAEGIARGAWLIKPNLRELAQIAGEESLDEQRQEQVARELVDSGRAEIVFVSLGAAGALVVSADLVERVRSPAVPVRSRVGAGDSTLAGVILGLARGDDLRRAVRFGIAAGAAAVMTPGSELTRKEDAERLYAGMLSESGLAND